MEEKRNLKIPHNIQAEEALLGAMLLSPKAVDAALEIVSAGDFYRPAHGMIFHAAATLYNTGQQVDPVTVANYLLGEGLLDHIGGAGILLTLQNATPATTTAGRYAQIILKHSKLRQVMTVGREMLEEAANLPEDINEFIDRSESHLFSINDGTSVDSLAPVGEAMIHSMDRLDHLFRAGDAITGLPTGFMDLDDILSGLQPSALVTLGARPSMGKTALALGIASHASVNLNIPTLFFSLEMGQSELTQRLLCSEGMINSKKIKNGDMYESDWDKVFPAIRKISRAPLWIDDNPNLTITELRSKARRLKARIGNLGLIVVDYLQLMSGSNGENRQQDVSDISRGCKILARELETPVLALSQLNRGLEQRANKRPMLSDLRESGAIEQDSDVVMFIYRDEIYNEDSDDKGTAELIIAKHRNGPTGTIRLGYMGPYTKFVNMARSD